MIERDNKDLPRAQLTFQDLETLNRILEMVWKEKKVEDLLQRIIEETLRLFQADQGSIILIGYGEHGSVKTIIREDKSAQSPILDHYMNNLFAGWIVQNKKPLLTNNLLEIFGEKNIKWKYRVIASVLALPLQIENKIIGVFNLISLNSTIQFTGKDLYLSSIFASQCAHLIKNARLYEELIEESVRLRKQISRQFSFTDDVTHSPQMEMVYSVLERVIPTDVRVLIQGESGTGKERIARSIHHSGPRKNGPFVAVDCGALPANLLESELFGYVKGAFTGAAQDRKGLFEEAIGGTLFLDEVGNMPPEIQSKLLRAIQENEIRPLGTSKVRKVDVRIISAISGDLAAKLKAGKLREDLYYRLNVVGISLPALRERREDIPLLASHFLKLMNERYRKKMKGIDPKTVYRLENYSWPGNIRELEHAIERAVVLCESSQLKDKDFPFLDAPTDAENKLLQPQPWKEALQNFRKNYLKNVLQQTGGNQAKAARILRIQRTYLNKLLKEM